MQNYCHPIKNKAQGVISALAWVAVAAIVYAPWGSSPSYAQSAPPGASVADLSRSAEFTVTTRVINPDLQAFTANVVGIGNSLIDGGSFEPVVFRNRYMAAGHAQDRVWLTREAATHWDSLAEGALDGAEVRVYRIEQGRFRLVRQDRVAEGGAAASGWTPVHRTSSVVPRDQPQFVFRWDTMNRPGVPYYFTVRSVNAQGEESADAMAVSFVRPERLSDARPNNPMQAFEASRLPALPGALPVPQGLRGQLNSDGTLTLTWNPVDSGRVVGYRVYRSDLPPQQHRGFFFDLEGQSRGADQAIRQGDLVFVSKTFDSASRQRYHTHRVWGAGTETRLLMPRGLEWFPDEDPRMRWELVAHTPNSPVADPGQTFLRLTVGTTNPARLRYFNHAGTGQSYYPVLRPEPYTVEVWLRRTRGVGTVRFSLAGFYNEPSQRVAPVSFTPGPEWRKFTATFTPPVVQPGSRANDMVLEFLGPGEFEVDNFRVYRSGTPFMDLDAVDYARLQESGMGYLRTHALIKTGRRTYNLEQLIAPAGVTSSAERHNTLPQTLRIIEQAGLRPWLQVEPHFSPAEWLGLVEYLAAPYDPAVDSPESKPWAYQRYLQGQQTPWVQVFDQWKFELGNETWNNLFAPWVFEAMTDAATGQRYSPGAVYGLYQEYVLRILRSSPYWQTAGLDQRFAFVLGGWNGFDYGRDAAQRSPNSHYLTIAAYNGGWDAGEGPPALTPESYFNALNQVSQVTILNGQRHLQEVQQISQQRGRALHLGTYEAGPGYALNGLNNERVSPEQALAQEQVMKSLAVGTATIDTFLAQAALGFRTQNFFIFREGTTWSSHAHWHQGGHAYPSWAMLALFNRESLGDLVEVRTDSVPTVALSAYRRRSAVAQAPLVATYAVRQGPQRWAVWLVSRKVPDYPRAGDAGYTPVTVHLPFSRAQSITLHALTGDYRAHNFGPQQVAVSTQELETHVIAGGRLVLGAQSAFAPRGLPPASTFLLVFDGVSP